MSFFSQTVSRLFHASVKALRTVSATCLFSGLTVTAFAQDTATPAPAPVPAPLPIVVNGTIEANYTVNFNQPYNGSNVYLFNTREGQFAINLAEVRASKIATPESRTGFTIRLIDGEVRKTNFNLGEGNNNDPTALPNILEAYGTFLVPFGGRDMKVDVGQFVTHVGYETIDIGTNNFFSRNFLFQFPSPFYNAGVRAAFPLSNRTTVTGFLLNRYNGVNDTGNRDIAPGFQIAQVLSPASTLILNGLYSRDNIAYNGTQQPGIDLTTGGRTEGKPLGVIDFVYTNQFSPGFKLVAEGLYRFGEINTQEKPDGEDYNVTGGALYLVFPFKNGNTFALRGEYLAQSLEQQEFDFFALGGDKPDKKTNLSSITASYELRAGIFPGMRTFLEYRYDTSNQKVFFGENGGERKSNQSTVTLGQVYAF